MQDPGALDELGVRGQSEGEVEEPAGEMTDADVQEGPGGPSEGERTLENPAAEPPEGAQRGTGALVHNISTRHPPPAHRMSAYMEGFGDFEEFVLDFDDYDLLESIHTHLGSPEETDSKYTTGMCRTLEEQGVVLEEQGVVLEEQGVVLEEQGFLTNT